MKKLFFTFLLGSITMPHVWAQQHQGNKQSAPEPTPLTEEKEQAVLTNRLDILPIEWPDYGSLLIDWGFNFLRDCPKEMKNKAFGARSLKLSGYYNIRLGKSHFVISPGIGVGFEGYQFKKLDKRYRTLVRKKEDRAHTTFEEANKLFSGNTAVTQSKLDVNYWDALLEFRFNTDSKYPKEGFFVAIGGNLGVPWNIATTIKYKEDEETKTTITYESFNLNKLRGGAHVRLGWGRFSAFYTHTFSNLFSKEKGPETTTTKPCSLGVSIDLF